MAKIAGYIYALNKKGDATYDTDELIKFLHTKAEEKGVAINEVYIDGDPSVPNGIEELVSDIRNYDGVMLYSLEGLSEDHIVALGRKSLFCVNAPWVAGKAASAELKAVIRSRAVSYTHLELPTNSHVLNSGVAVYIKKKIRINEEHIVKIPAKTHQTHGIMHNKQKVS